MPPIPDFEPRANYPYKVLPDGVHPCRSEELFAVFVDGFEGSTSRRAIGEGFLKLQAEVTKIGLAATQWVDGSFVEEQLNPRDVDVVTFCDYDSLHTMVASTLDAVIQLVDGREGTKPTFQSHTFLVVSCPPGHPYTATFEANRAYWREWFGKTREIPDPPGPDLPGHPKGFIRMTLGEFAPAIETGRSAP